MLASCRPGDREEAAQGEDARNEGGVGNTARRRKVAAHDGRGFAVCVSADQQSCQGESAAGDGTRSGVVCLEGEVGWAAAVRD